MSGQRRLAISYSRFSDPKQAKGDSETRQDQMFRGFCTRHNLTPLAEVFADRGRSGYKDEHRKKGRLGQLIAMAKDGRFEPGTVIVVEAWDRLGRLRPDRQTELVAELLRTGVCIGVCRLEDIFCEDDFGTHKWTTLAVFIQLAYQESKQKAERVAASWERRRESARTGGRLATNRLPAWIELGPGGKPRLIPERAATVKRIFRLAAEGMGYRRIIGTLDREGVPAFGEAVVREGRSRPQFSGRWTRSYVTLLLNDRRAVGEFQPFKAGDAPDGKRRRHVNFVPDGPPIPGYYPAAVTEQEFLLARAGQAERANHGSRRQRDAKYVNVFRGLLRHARDGEGIMVHNRGTSEAPQLVLHTASGVEGRAPCYTFPYPIFEEKVLEWLREIDPREVLPHERAANRADVLRAKLQQVRDEVAKLSADLRQGYSKALAQVLREQEAEEERVANELQDELARSVRPAARAWKEVPSLVDLLRNSPDPDAARLRLRSVLRTAVDEIWLLLVRRGCVRLCAVQVFFRSGVRRDYLIGYQPAANRRGGWAKGLSFAGKPLPGDLDLRDRGQARRLEAALAAVNVEELAARMGR
jgi:DNA invertase Pin-like site-specific DNA recombinase